MRWDNLFDDLESQLEHELTADDLDLQVEEERLRLGRMSLRDRLAALQFSSSADLVIRVVLADGNTLSLRPVALGKDWVSGDIVGASSRRQQCIIPLQSLAGIVLDGDQVRPSLDEPAAGVATRDLSARLGLVFVLRDLCRRRRALDFELGATSVHGTIDRVGRDHIDVAVHERGVARRERAVLQYRVIPLTQLSLVRL